MYSILYILSVFCIRLISSNCPESNSHENNQQHKKRQQCSPLDFNWARTKIQVVLRYKGDYTTQLGIITSHYQDPQPISKPIGSRCGIFTYVWLILMVFMYIGRYTSPMDASWVMKCHVRVQRFTLLKPFFCSGHDLLQWAQAHFGQCPFGLAS